MIVKDGRMPSKSNIKEKVLHKDFQNKVQPSINIKMKIYPWIITGKTRMIVQLLTKNK